MRRVPVLITAPSSHIKGEEPVYLAERWLRGIDELVPLHQRYADLVRKVAREEEVLLLDLLAKFYRLPAKDLKETYFVEDGIHLTSEGCWEVANALYRFFEQEGLLEKILE
jgi:predicted nuclease with TOPRIM domain